MAAAEAAAGDETAEVRAAARAPVGEGKAGAEGLGLEEATMAADRAAGARVVVSLGEVCQG